MFSLPVSRHSAIRKGASTAIAVNQKVRRNTPRSLGIKVCAAGFGSTEDPAPRFEVADLGFMFKCQPDVVQPSEQALAFECVYVKSKPVAEAILNCLPLKIDRQLIARTSPALAKQRCDLVFEQADREHSVFEAVVIEDVGKRRCND